MSFSKFTIKDNRQIKEARESLMELVRRRCPDAEEQATVERALKFVGESHKHIRRRTGEPYVIHPIEVAKIVISDIGLGYKSICAALLHDVFEDTDYDIGDIRSLFGETIAALVEGMAKIKNVLDDESRKEFKSTQNLQAENFRYLERLAEVSPETRIYSNMEPTMLYYDMTASSADISLGKDAAYYCPEIPNVTWNSDIQPFGFRGIRDLMNSIAKAMKEAHT